jgi:predicted dehydrogenase
MTRLTRREFVEDTLLAAAAAIATPPLVSHAAEAARTWPSQTLRVAVVGVNGRGGAHVSAFKKLKGVEVAAFCDVDHTVFGDVKRSVPMAQTYTDIRKLLEDKSIDAISIATPNHWHSLMAIWAVQAGKHVYVEKPLSHNVFEGRKLVEAAAKYGKIVQVGTQARSQQATREAMAFLHDGGLGKISHAVGLCYKPRPSIGFKPIEEPPANLDFDLWLGPAPKQPFHRNLVHYNWHWFWDFGNGDIGNQGPHQLDIARWGLGKQTLPSKILSLGGRLGYKDQAQSANTQIALYDYGDTQIVFEVRGLNTAPYKNAKIGVVFHGEKGYLVSDAYSKVVAFDPDGKQVKVFSGGEETAHFKNFVDAIRSGKTEDLTAPSIEGHLSAALAHLANTSYRLGADRSFSETDAPFGSHAGANDAFARMKEHLTANRVDLGATPYRMGAALTLDPAKETFTGERAADANKLLTREYRKGFEVPAAV